MISKWFVLLHLALRICADDDNKIIFSCADSHRLENGSRSCVCERCGQDVIKLDAANDISKLPACKVVTFKMNETKLSVTERDVTVTVGKAGHVTLTSFELSEHNSTVTFCYPLSPQLLQCDLKRLDMANYTEMAVTKSLRNVATNETIGFRDYYKTGGGYFGCTLPINENRKLRCNYVVYRRDEYNLGAGNRTIYLLPTKETVYHPTFTDLTDGDIRLCYPSSPPFTFCSLWFLEKSEFEIMADHRLRSFTHRRTYELGEFLIFADQRGVICAEITPPLMFDYFLIHASLFVVSAVCLLTALIVHLIIPSLNYHAKPLLCQMVSMVVMYIGMAVRKFLVNITPGVCYTLFVTTYVSALASFFWLSVLAYDLWSIFSNLQTSSQIGCRPRTCGSKRTRFYVYSVYAWGLPLLLCAFAVTLDLSPNLQDALTVYPNISKMCWFNTKKSAYLLLYAPMFFVLVANFSLYFLTVVNLKRASKGVEVVNKNFNQQLLFVCIRLFVVMGLCWTVEAVTWTLDLNSTFVYIPDTVIAVQGIIIFIVYICKPKTVKLLRKKFSSKSQLGTSTRWTTDGMSSRYQSEQNISTLKNRS